MDTDRSRQGLGVKRLIRDSREQIELDRAYGPAGAELRFRGPLTAYSSLERCLRDGTRGVVSLVRLGEAVIRT